MPRPQTKQRGNSLQGVTTDPPNPNPNAS